MVSKKERKRPFAWISNLPSTQLTLFSVILFVISLFCFLSYNYQVLGERNKLDNTLKMSRSISTLEADLASLQKPDQQKFELLVKHRNEAVDHLNELSVDNNAWGKIIGISSGTSSDADLKKLKSEFNKINTNINYINENSTTITKFLNQIREAYSLMPEIRKQINNFGQQGLPNQDLLNQVNFIEYKLVGLLLIEGGNINSEDINSLILNIRDFLTTISNIQTNQTNQNITNTARKIDQISKPLVSLHKGIPEYVKVISSFSSLLTASSEAFRNVQATLINLEFQAKNTISSLSFYQIIAYTLLSLFLLSFVVLLLHFREKAIKATEAERLAKQNKMSKSSMSELVKQLEPLQSGNLSIPIHESDINLMPFVKQINSFKEHFINIFSNANIVTHELNRAYNNYKKKSLSVKEINVELNRKMEDAIINLGNISKQIDTVGQKVWKLSEHTNIMEEKMEYSVINSKKTTDKMDSIKLNVQEANKKMKKVGEDYQNVTEFLSDLKEVSKKSKVLALNATIQSSSMSSESSKEFSVIAQEVQKLSNNSDEIAQKIESVINKNKESVAECMKSLEMIVQELIAGSIFLDNNNQYLVELQTLSHKIHGTINVASNSLQERSNDISDVSVSMKSMESGSEMMTKTIEDITELVDTLGKATNDFNKIFSKVKT